MSLFLLSREGVGTRITGFHLNSLKSLIWSNKKITSSLNTASDFFIYSIEHIPAKTERYAIITKNIFAANAPKVKAALNR